jgi:hypothetical protein
MLKINNTTKFLVVFGIVFIIFNLYLIEIIRNEETNKTELNSKINILQKKIQILSDANKNFEKDVETIKESIQEGKEKIEINRKMIERKNEERLIKKENEVETKKEHHSDKLIIHLIPHCHLDAGWLKTVEEYYQAEVKSIINTLIPALESHPERRFVWVEIGFLNRWWGESSEEDHQRFIKLIKNGQIELIMGGNHQNIKKN